MVTFLWILLAILGFVCIAFLALFIFVLRVAWYAQKLMFGLPWMVWLTHRDVVNMGYSGLYSRLLLPIYHEMGNVEVRVLDSLSEEEKFEVKLHGFSPFTIQCYEFRLTKRPRKKRIEIKSILPQLGWKPATT